MKHDFSAATFANPNIDFAAQFLADDYAEVGSSKRRSVRLSSGSFISHEDSQEGESTVTDPSFDLKTSALQRTYGVSQSKGALFLAIVFGMMSSQQPLLGNQSSNHYASHTSTDQVSRILSHTDKMSPRSSTSNQIVLKEPNSQVVDIGERLVSMEIDSIEGTFEHVKSGQNEHKPLLQSARLMKNLPKRSYNPVSTFFT